MKFSKEDRVTLFRIARTAIESGLEGKKYLPEPHPRLSDKYGVFVTLKKDSRLRGCIGYIEPIKPLYQAVAEMAYSAAYNDPRFPPVSKEELSHLTIEMTILSPMRRIDNIEEIEVGRHGLFVRKGIFQGLLLPQVAVEECWDRMTFLRHTCFKAGLPEDAWKDAELFVFCGEIIKE